MAKGVEGLGAKLAKKGTKAVIHIDQLSEQTASVAIKEVISSKAVMFKDQQSRQLQITLRDTWQGKPLWPPSRSREARRLLDALTRD